MENSQDQNLTITSVASDLGAVSHLDALLATVGSVDGLRILDIGYGEGNLSRALCLLAPPWSARIDDGAVARRDGKYEAGLRMRSPTLPVRTSWPIKSRPLPT